MNGDRSGNGGADTPLYSERTRYRIESLAVLSGPLFTVCALVGWVLLSQGLLPFAPSSPAESLAQSYEDAQFSIILGNTIFLVGCGFLIFWVAQLGVMLASLEGRRPVLAIAQVLGGFGVAAFTSTACVLWIGAAYRSGTSGPDVVVGFNDAGWFSFLLTWPGLAVQMVATGIVIWLARHRRDRLAPGWVAIFCFVSAAVFAMVALPAFTKVGPFAWNGLLGYYLPFVFWGATFEILSWSMLRSLRRARRCSQREVLSGSVEHEPLSQS